MQLPFRGVREDDRRARGRERPDVGKLLTTDLDLGDGNDTFHTRNDSTQRIDRGTGTDTAQVDATDVVTAVETVQGARGPKVAIRSKRLPVKRGKASVRITCPAGETSCTGRARILRRGKTVGSVAVELDGGQSRTFRIALNRKTRIALARQRDDRLPVTVKVSVKDAAGATGKTSKRIDLKG